MMLLHLAVLLLVAASGAAVVLTRRVDSQVIGVSFFGLMLALMFLLFQAADVALSQIVIGTVGLPLMVLLAIAKMRRDVATNREQEKLNKPQEEDEHAEEPQEVTS